MEGLIEGGVDLIVVETFTDIVEIQSAVRAARSLGDLPIVAMMTVDVEGRTPEGVPPEWFARKLVETEADVLGVNCSVGPAPMLSVIEAMAAVTDRPLAAMPNAGLPRDIDGRMHYLTSPAYLGSYAKRFAAAGARVVGGCCGVTPEHVRAMKEALDERSVRQAVPRITVEPPRSHPHAPVPREERTTLARKIASGRFVLLLELVPPRGWEVGSLREEVRAAAAAGFDGALVLSDPRFAGRVSSLAVARVVREACGSANDFEPVMQYAARDRLLPDVVCDLFGAQAL
jgi:homocysteine S-methyltransferase